MFSLIKFIQSPELFVPKNPNFNATNVQTNAAIVYWTLPQERFTGFKFRINNRDEESCIMPDKLPSNKQAICNITRDDIAFYQLNNLEPGTQYNMTIRTYKMSAETERVPLYSEPQVISVYTSMQIF